MKKLTNIFIITLAAMLILSANVCTASAATSGSGMLQYVFRPKILSGLVTQVVANR